MKNKVLDKLNSVQPTSQTLAEKVADQLNNLIVEQKLKPNDKMPNEFELCDKLDVGRGTIREAEKILVARGVLVIQQGKGTFIASHPGMIEDPFGLLYMGNKKKLISELYDIRHELEPWIAEQAAINRTDEDVANLQIALDKLNNATKNRLDEMIDDDIHFHTLIAEATKNRVLPKILPAINLSIYSFLSDNRINYADLSIKTHTEIFEAIKQKKPAAAKKAMLKHLELNLEAVGTLIDNKKSN